MLTGDDLQKIGKVFDKTVENKLESTEKRLISSFKEESKGLEERIITQVRLEMIQELSKSEERIIEEVGNFVNDSLLPQIDDLGKRLKKVESLPTITHQLKLKK